jgi:hypothetical protein
MDVGEFRCWNCGKAYGLDDEGDAGAEITDGSYATEGERPASEIDYRTIAAALNKFGTMTLAEQAVALDMAKIVCSKKADKDEKVAALLTFESVFKDGK